MMGREVKREAAIERSIYASDLLIQPEIWVRLLLSSREYSR